MIKLFDNFSAPNLEFIINGDLNCDLLKNTLENHIKHFVYACETHHLTQLVNKPTRITPTSHSLVDMIMTTCPYLKELLPGNVKGSPKGQTNRWPNNH